MKLTTENITYITKTLLREIKKDLIGKTTLFMDQQTLLTQQYSLNQKIQSNLYQNSDIFAEIDMLILKLIQNCKTQNSQNIPKKKTHTS